MAAGVALDRAVLHGSDSGLGGKLLARKRRELEESRLSALAPRGAGLRRRQLLQSLRLDRKVIDVDLMGNAVSAITQLAQAEIFGDEVLHLIDEFAITVAHKIGMRRAHFHTYPLRFHGIVCVGARRERIEIGVDNGVAAGNAGSVRATTGAYRGILARTEMQQQRADVAFQSVAAIQRSDAVVAEIGMVVLPHAGHDLPAGLRG